MKRTVYVSPSGLESSTHCSILERKPILEQAVPGGVVSGAFWMILTLLLVISRR